MKGELLGDEVTGEDRGQIIRGLGAVVRNGSFSLP